MQYMTELFENIKSQIESDETYFCKFWTYEQKKLGPDDPIIYSFIDNSVRPFLMKLEEILTFYNKNAPIFCFIMEVELKKLNEQKNEQEKNKFSSSFYQRLLVLARKAKEGFVKAYEQWLEHFECNAKNEGVLMPAKTFSVKKIKKNNSI